VPRATVYESAELRELRCRYKRLEQENEVLRRVAAFFARALIERVAELARSPGMCWSGYPVCEPLGDGRGRSRARQMIRWRRRPRAPTAISSVTFSTNWECRTPRLAPASVRHSESNVSGGGDGGNRDEDADERTRPSFGQRDDADYPGQYGDHHREQVRAIDEVGNRPDSSQVEFRGVPGPSRRQ
jgi:hypothetical protein